MPTPATSASLMRSRRIRVTGIALAVGGLCCLVALFLPWVRAYYPPVAGDPATIVYDGPGVPLANGIGDLIGPLHRWTVEVSVETLVFLILPAYSLIFGLALLLGARWAANRAASRLGLIASGLGLLFTLFFAYVYVNIVGGLDVIRATRTLEVGAVLACAGYACALIGSTLAAGVHTARPRAT